jgi:ACR3 family arsenite efflux pump ArsB
MASRFNVGALVVALAVAAGWSVRTYLVMSPTVDVAWWPVISVLGALIIIPLVLGLAAAVRSFVMFRRSVGPSRQ